MGVLLPIAAPPDVGVEWIPISKAQFLQRVCSLGNILPSRRHYHAPESGGKLLNSRKIILLFIGRHSANVRQTSSIGQPRSRRRNRTRPRQIFALATNLTDSWIASQAQRRLALEFFMVHGNHIYNASLLDLAVQKMNVILTSSLSPHNSMRNGDFPEVANKSSHLIFSIRFLSCVSVIISPAIKSILKFLTIPDSQAS